MHFCSHALLLLCTFACCKSASLQMFSVWNLDRELVDHVYVLLEWVFQLQTCTRCISALSIFAHMHMPVQPVLCPSLRSLDLEIPTKAMCIFAYMCTFASCTFVFVHFASALFHMQKCNNICADVEVLNWWRWGFLWTWAEQKDILAVHFCSQTLSLLFTWAVWISKSTRKSRWFESLCCAQLWQGFHWNSGSWSSRDWRNNRQKAKIFFGKKCIQMHPNGSSIACKRFFHMYRYSILISSWNWEEGYSFNLKFIPIERMNLETQIARIHSFLFKLLPCMWVERLGFLCSFASVDFKKAPDLLYSPNWTSSIVCRFVSIWISSCPSKLRATAVQNCSWSDERWINSWTGPSSLCFSEDWRNPSYFYCAFLLFLVLCELSLRSSCLQSMELCLTLVTLRLVYIKCLSAHRDLIHVQINPHRHQFSTSRSARVSLHFCMWKHARAKLH